MIILISGKQGSGKTTVTGNLTAALQAKGYEVTPVKFAGPLYAMHDAVLKVLAFYGVTRNIVKDGPLLQMLGTDWGRKTIADDIWVQLAKNRVKDILTTATNPNQAVIIDDCRFENEFDAFPDAYKVRLDCPRDIRKTRCEAWRTDEMHLSETGLDNYAELGKFDAYFQSENLTSKDIADVLIRAIDVNTNKEATQP